jgi:DUF4097 and DUF4098 domain-containing protein YvlB
MTQEYLKSLLDYNPETGKFIWRVNNKNYVKSGSEAGWIDSYGYRVIGIDKKGYKGHRLAWLWYYGRWPENEIDHINHNRGDNRIKNLREVSHQENVKNRSRPRNNTSGHVGVHWYKGQKKWCANIESNGKKIYLGSFKEKEDAVKARKEAEAKYKFHQNHGR